MRDENVNTILFEVSQLACGHGGLRGKAKAPIA
jgi:hypothetical protein